MEDIPSGTGNVERAGAAARHEANESLRVAIDALPHAVINIRGAPLSALPLCITYCNPAFEHLTGWTKGELARRGWKLLLGDAPEGDPLYPLREKIKHGHYAHTEFLVGHRDGSCFWAGIEFVPTTLSAKSWTVILRDASGRVRAELKEKHKRQRLLEVIQSFEEGVVLLDLDGRVLYLNQTCEKLLECSNDGATGRPLWDILHLLDSERRPFGTLDINRVLYEGRTLRIEDGIYVESQAKGLKALKLCASPLRDASREITGCALFLSMPALRLYSDEQEAPQSEPIAFSPATADLIHDFNNILTGLQGNLSILREHPGSSQSDQLSIAERAVERAQDLCDQLRHAHKRMKRGSEPFSIAELIEESTAFILSNGNCRFRNVLPQSLWLADADEGRISQVMNNLLINATQAMPEGGVIEVRAENVEYSEDSILPTLNAGHYVKVTVNDNGPGIPTDKLEKVFDPYFTTKKTGTGLGLSGCRKIIREHGGDIFVKSSPGQGASFSFYLPAIPGPGGTPATSASATSASPAQVTPEVPLTPDNRERSVIVMDDERMVRQITCDMLTHLGYRAISAENGEQVIEYYLNALKENRRFDLVLLDLNIPGGMGALDTISRLREADPTVCAILSTGYANHPAFLKHPDYGFKAGISKPYNIDQIARVAQLALKPAMA